MNKELILILGKSIFITIAVALVFSFFASSFGLNFVSSFLFCILLQYIGFYFYGEYVKRKRGKLKLDTELKIIEQQLKQQATVVCPCDRNVETTIPININGENRYKCPGCLKDVTVFVSTKTALATTPTDTITPIKQ